MSEAAQATPAPVVPTNGAQSGQQKPAPPPKPKPTAGQSASPAPAQGSSTESAGKNFVNSGTTTPEPQKATPNVTRGPNGKFVGKNGEASATEAPKDGATSETERPRFKHRDIDLDVDSVYSELKRTRAQAQAISRMEKEIAAAAEEKKAREARKAKALEGDDSILDDLGLTPEQEAALLSKRLYGKHIRPAELKELDPEKLELEELREYRARVERDTQSKKDDEDRVVFEKSRAEFKDSLAKDFLEKAKAAGIPGTREAIRKVAERIRFFEENGHQIDVETAAAAERQEIGVQTGWFAEEATPAELTELWGEERYRKFADTNLVSLTPAEMQKTLGAPLFKKLVENIREFLLGQVPRAPMPVAKPQLVKPISNGHKRDSMTPAQFNQKFDSYFKGNKG